MKYTPTPLPDENVNVSKRSPLVDLFTLLGGSLLLLGVFYWILGLVVDYYAPRLSLETETQLGESFSESFSHELEAEQQRKQAYLQGLMDQLVKEKYGKAPHLNYQVHLDPDATANAFAFPGGHIVVMEGLVDQASSENELVFVLGHEMGHLHHRHNLRAIGRGLALYVMTEAIFGGGSGLSKNVGAFTQSFQQGFSRAQELEADHTGLEALYGHYHHVGGVMDFLSRHEQEVGFTGTSLGQYFSSHPHPQGRMERLNGIIQSKGWSQGEKQALPDFSAAASGASEPSDKASGQNHKE